MGTSDPHTIAHLYIDTLQYFYNRKYDRFGNSYLKLAINGEMVEYGIMHV